MVWFGGPTAQEAKKELLKQKAALCARFLKRRSPRKAVEYTALQTLREAGKPYRLHDAIWSAVASEARHRFG
jgi:hypothetical protein